MVSVPVPPPLIASDLRPAKTAGQYKTQGSEAGENAHVRSKAADLEKISLVFNKKLQFVVDQQSKEITVKVIDKETDKVIRELPPEELQQLHNNLKETFGLLFDERV
jgi:flagellar protein FlaG